MKSVVLISILAVLVLGACRKDKTAPILFVAPNHFPSPHFQFENFDLSQERIDLGKSLFHDPILSSDLSISCASCHYQDAGFSDPGKAFSTGVNDSLSARNSMPLVNLAWNTSFFWDGGVNHIEVTSFAPITNSKEMNENLTNVIHKLSLTETYPKMFQNAYQEDTITAQRLLWSLAAYMSTLVSYESKYDEVYQGNTSFNESEQHGYMLFQRDCISCHSEPLTTNFNFENNGIDSIYLDIGRERISMNTADHGKFKIPSLRNIAESFPYMHDGRFNTLEEVILHYSEGIQASPTLSHQLPVGGFHYSNLDKEGLLDFLLTLSDDNFLYYADY